MLVLRLKPDYLGWHMRSITIWPQMLLWMEYPSWLLALTHIPWPLCTHPYQVSPTHPSQMLSWISHTLSLVLRSCSPWNVTYLSLSRSGSNITFAQSPFRPWENSAILLIHTSILAFFKLYHYYMGVCIHTCTQTHYSFIQCSPHITHHPYRGPHLDGKTTMPLELLYTQCGTFKQKEVLNKSWLSKSND